MNLTSDRINELSVNAGPQDSNWIDRLKEEYTVLINYIENLKKDDQEWFKIESDETGTKWSGVCWVIYDLVKYEFKLEFEVPPAYPMSNIELVLPELDGKTEKMYRGGKICQDIHFAPLWSKKTPKLGIAHALAQSVR
jgi:ufm1-conjugating enzyme 1